MFRLLLELVITILGVMVARAVIASIMKGIASSTAEAFRRQQTGTPSGPQSGSAPVNRDVPRAGDLHKDPVCGTYVSEASGFKRQSGGQTFYYCSKDCREKHALVAR